MNRSIVRLVPLCLLALSLSGCAASAKFQSPDTFNAQAGQTIVNRSIGYLWGIVPPPPLSLQMCGEAGIKKMKVKQGFWDKLITNFSLGIVISHKVKTVCAAPGGAAAPIAPTTPAELPPAETTPESIPPDPQEPTEPGEQ